MWGGHPGAVTVAGKSCVLALGIRHKLMKRPQDKAPGWQMESVNLTDDCLERLASGTLDFVINLDQPYSEPFVAHPMLSAAPMFWFRKEHPLARKREISIADACAYPQIAFQAQNVSASDFRVIEKTLADAGLIRRSVLDTSHLILALDTLANPDAVMLAPAYLMRLPIVSREFVHRSISHIAAFDHLRINLALVQHARTLNSALHCWFISETKAALASGG